MTQYRTIKTAFFAFLFLLPVQVSAEGIAPLLQQASQREDVAISYDDLSYILGITVLEAGRSDRHHAAPPEPGIGRRVVKGNTSSTRFEGNRLYFPAFEGRNLEALKRIRAEMEAMPDAVPFAEWTRNQQLAYWLNLYNITIIELIADRYPEQELRRLLYGKGGRGGLLDEPVLKVAGVRLSLNDIHHEILIPVWRDPLVMYGLFHGYVGSPNIRAEAYTAGRVWEQLRDNAAEFINSNRGARMDGDTLRVAELYSENLALFPGGPDALKAHVATYADAPYAERFRAAKDVRATTSDYYIADLFQGYRTDTNPNVGNVAVIYEALTGAANADTAGWMAATMERYYSSSAPGLVMDYFKKIRERKAAREGNVSVEEFEEDASAQDAKP